MRTNAEAGWELMPPGFFFECIMRLRRLTLLTVKHFIPDEFEYKEIQGGPISKGLP